MEQVHVADVGDGLCLAVKLVFGEGIQIDCGGESAKEARDSLIRIQDFFVKPSVFVLSHFHIDHYNGLLYHSITQPIRKPARLVDEPVGGWIREVYFPRLPDFPRREEFLEKMFTINLMVFGNETGVMEYDLLEAIKRLNWNSYNFSAQGLSKGDIIYVDGSHFEVLWPPRVVQEGMPISLVKKALRDFEVALEDDEMRQLYERVKDEARIWSYLEDEGLQVGESDLEETTRNEPTNRYLHQHRRRKRLPEKVAKANESLRNAANHLGLILFEDNRFLFLGDAEEYEIKRTVADLESKGRTFFKVLITPHHGTHWHNSLGRIGCWYAITSNGPKWASKLKFGFKQIGLYPFATFANGDITKPD